jgi:hypothetical protein
MFLYAEANCGRCYNHRRQHSWRRFIDRRLYWFTMPPGWLCGRVAFLSIWMMEGCFLSNFRCVSTVWTTLHSPSHVFCESEGFRFAAFIFLMLDLEEVDIKCRFFAHWTKRGSCEGGRFNWNMKYGMIGIVIWFAFSKWYHLFQSLILSLSIENSILQLELKQLWRSWVNNS